MPSLLKTVLLLWLVMWSLLGIQSLVNVAREGPLHIACMLFGLGLLSVSMRELLKNVPVWERRGASTVWRDRMDAKMIRVLLLQPDVGYALLLKRALEQISSPKHVTVLHNPAEMKRRLSELTQERLPNLLFLDGELPNDESFQLLRWIKNDPELRKIFVVFLISSSHISVARRAYRDQADACAGKPVQWRTLYSLLRLVEIDWRRCRAAAALSK